MRGGQHTEEKAKLFQCKRAEEMVRHLISLAMFSTMYKIPTWPCLVAGVFCCNIMDKTFKKFVENWKSTAL